MSYVYKEDVDNNLQYGLIAEEVAKIYPELIEYDMEGKPFTVKYHLLTPLLLKQLQVNREIISYQEVEMAKLKNQLGIQQAELTKILQRIRALESAPNK